MSPVVVLGPAQQRAHRRPHHRRRRRQGAGARCLCQEGCSRTHRHLSPRCPHLRPLPHHSIPPLQLHFAPPSTPAVAELLRLDLWSERWRVRQACLVLTRHDLRCQADLVKGGTQGSWRLGVARNPRVTMPTSGLPPAHPRPIHWFRSEAGAPFLQSYPGWIDLADHAQSFFAELAAALKVSVASLTS
jgi:hypothetical protein